MPCWILIEVVGILCERKMDLVNLILFGAVSIASAIYIFFKYKFTYWERRGVPHVSPTFPFGHLKGVGTQLHMSVWTQKFYEQFKGKDKLAGLYFMFKPSVLVLDTELVKDILIRDFSNFNDRGIYHNERDDPISAHLFTLNGEKWKPLRAKLTPTFTSGKMKFMFTTVVEVADRLRDCLVSNVESNGATVEMKDVLARFTTDVIGTCAFGVECNSLKDPESEFRTKGRDVFARPRHSSFVMTLVTSFKTISKMLHVKVVPDDISYFFINLVKQNIEYRETNDVRRNDFMDILINLQKSDNSLTTNEIAAQAFVFFLAGFETSSTTMTFCLFELARLPEVQARIRKNVREVLARHANKFTYEAMMEMGLVEQAINGR